MLPFHRLKLWLLMDLCLSLKLHPFIQSTPTCQVRKFMSLIGLFTATEKQVPLGRLHMRPIQWHLKRHWRIHESLEKEVPVPRTLHPHLQWWPKETNVLLCQPLHPLHHAIQIFTDASKEGWGALLGNFTASGTWSVPESQLHINFLEIKNTKKVPAHGTRESCSGCHGRLYSCGIHKQGGRYEVRLTLCPSMAAPVLVTCCPKGQTHPMSSECDCGHIVSSSPNNSDGMVSSSGGIRRPLSNLAPSPGRHLCD